MTRSGRTLLSERLGYAVSRGGASATAWWLLKKFWGIEAYHVIAYSNSAKTLRHKIRQPRFAFRSIATTRDVELLEPAVRAELEEHSGRDLNRLVSDHAVVYFISDGRQVVCQLVTSRNSEIRVDIPAGLIFDIGPRTAFLSYLFTHSNYRRVGAAQELLQLAWNDLGHEGFERVVAHVLATNVPSLGAFSAAGWRRIGTICKNARSPSWYAGALSDHGIRVRQDLANANGRK